MLALLRWRDPDARLLLALALVPVTGFAYDALPACLAARTRLQSAILTVVTQIGALQAPHLPHAHGYADLTWKNGTLVVWTCLLPALVLVLRRGVQWPAWMNWRDRSLKAFPE